MRMQKLVLFLSGILVLGVTCFASDMTFHLEGDKYNFSYAIEDEGQHTRQETRSEDGVVTGMYSYVDPSGMKRTVEYQAGPNGFTTKDSITDAGTYSFYFNTGDEGAHIRQENKTANGTVMGLYQYVDPNGDTRRVEYTAGGDGFHPQGDISVDKKAPEIAQVLSEKRPVAPENVLEPNRNTTTAHIQMVSVKYTPVDIHFLPVPLVYHTYAAF